MPQKTTFEKLFPRTATELKEIAQSLLREHLAAMDVEDTEAVIALLQEQAGQGRIAGHLPDLARLERACADATATTLPAPALWEALTLNPSLRIVRTRWEGLCGLALGTRKEGDKPARLENMQHILAWKNPKTLDLCCRPASSRDLLALKLVAEDLDPLIVAHEAAILPGRLFSALDQAVRDGLLQRPTSRIRRLDFTRQELGPTTPEDHVADVFTLQWHITQACDLHCKHCYDRGKRDFLERGKAVAILDDFQRFCAQKKVRGQVSFTGGNPLLHPDLDQLIREAATRGFLVAMLANPTSEKRIREILDLSPLSYFQVSLEGLEEHNDAIRGAGHYRRTIDFLDVLRDLRVYSTVMLTLTKANMDQVIPLGEALRGRANMLTFNRLSLVGEGAHLQPADPQAYPDFLRAYLRAADDNPVLGFKDNMLNPVRRQEGRTLFGGCTGFGCGAAFNFLAVLSDGEVHACRKFPSGLGNIFQQSLNAIYDSKKAEAFRGGSRACSGCSIRAVCGGCLAVTQSHGLDPLRDRDPYCPGGPLH